jgi:uncharacterized damage-inducible protein DinB
MPMLEHLSSVYRFNLQLAKMLVADIREEHMYQQPIAGMNHASWILGHLTMPRLWAKEPLKLDVTVPPDWVEKFNAGSTPVAKEGFYPSKAELIAVLEYTHAVMEAGLRKLTEEDLAQPTQNERMRKFMPQMGDVITGLMSTHESYHIGQLSGWRRAMGLPRVF